jgi:hypothetical protein
MIKQQRFEGDVVGNAARPAPGHRARRAADHDVLRRGRFRITV